MANQSSPLAQLAAAAAGMAPFSPSALGGLPGGVLPIRPQAFSPVTNARDNAPCNTLFIGNLGDNVSEAELRGLFGTQPGYRQLKVVCGPRSTTAFVEFHDVGSAMAVHDSLQGAVLLSSDRGGIRIQYSKNPFGKRSPVGTPERASSNVSAAGGGPSGLDFAQLAGIGSALGAAGMMGPPGGRQPGSDGSGPAGMGGMLGMGPGGGM